MSEFRNTKIFLLKVTHQIGDTVSWTYLINDLND